MTKKCPCNGQKRFAHGTGMCRLLVLCLLIMPMAHVQGAPFSGINPPAGPADGGEREWVAANDPRIQLSDGLNQISGDDGAIHFDRVIDGPDRGFRWDAPGARVRWRTDSPEVVVRLRYSDRHIGSSRNSIGVFRIDGQSDPDWRFTRPAPGNAPLDLPLPVPAGGAFHDYELILPYADSVDILGVEVQAGANWEQPQPRPETRYLAFGDSVTHGFTASVVTGSYAFLTAERNDWELVNLGIGGRGTNASDGAFLGALDASVVSILIGVNDWQGGAGLEWFRDNYDRLLAGLRESNPEVPVFVVTPLWVPPSWQPASVKHPLEDYREQIRQSVAALEDPLITVIEGPSLIDHDPKFFDPIAVHPNDDGFKQMAERLSAAMRAVVSIGNSVTPAASAACEDSL